MKQQKPSTVFLDFSFYKGQQNESIIKELSFIDLYGKISEKASFKPPYSIDTLDNKTRYTVRWCQNNLHTLPFEAGELPYRDMGKMLLQLSCSLPAESIIYVKGLEKRNFLNDLFYSLDYLKPILYEMESELKTPSLQILRRKYPTIYKWSKCDLHTDNCSFGNVFLLKQWYINKILLKHENVYKPIIVNCESDEVE